MVLSRWSTHSYRFAIRFLEMNLGWLRGPTFVEIFLNAFWSALRLERSGGRGRLSAHGEQRRGVVGLAVPRMTPGTDEMEFAPSK